VTPKVPIDVSIDFITGYIRDEPLDVQFTIIANVLMRFLTAHVPPEEHQAALQSILETLPTAALLNLPHVGGRQ
jgi:hypothetical protein